MEKDITIAMWGGKIQTVSLLMKQFVVASVYLEEIF